MGFWNGLETHNGYQLPRIVLFRARDNGRGLGSSLFELGYSRFRSSKKPRKVTHLFWRMGKKQTLKNGGGCPSPKFTARARVAPVPPPRGLGENFNTYTSPSTTFPCHSSPRLILYLMSSPSPPALQRLHRLTRSSPGFHDQLNNVLYGEEYRQCLPNLQGDYLVWLVDYLDEVSRCVAFPRSPLKPE